jgi:hypothetical protein
MQKSRIYTNGSGGGGGIRGNNGKRGGWQCEPFSPNGDIHDGNTDLFEKATNVIFRCTVAQIGYEDCIIKDGRGISFSSVAPTGSLAFKASSFLVTITMLAVVMAFRRVARTIRLNVLMELAMH